MPKFLETILGREASRKGMSGRRKERYIFGALNNQGAMRGNKETARGRAMSRKHKRKMARGGRS